MRPQVEAIKAQPAVDDCALLFPEKIGAERWIAAGLFVAACLYLCIFRRFMLLDPDEGIVLQGAERILRGEVLYRDFFSFFTPGSYYLLALLFKTFGNSLLVARMALVSYGGIFTVFAYWTARRTCSRSTSLLTAYLTIVMSHVALRGAAQLGQHSVVMYRRVLRGSVGADATPGMGVRAGKFRVLDLSFRTVQRRGAHRGGLFLGFAALTWLQRPLPFGWVHAVAFAAGLVWPLALTVGYFGGHHALGAMFADWNWPLHHYVVANKVPYGYSDWSDEARESLFGTATPAEAFLVILTLSPCFLLPVLPIIGLVLLVYWVIAARRGALAPERAAYYVVATSAVAGALLSVVFVRTNVIHFAYLAPIFYLVLAWLIDGSDIRGEIVRSMRPILALGIFVTFTAVAMALLITNRNARTVTETRRGAVRFAGPDQVLAYTQAHVPAGEKIFVYPYFPLAYYLTATFSATRYEYLPPGMHTREQDEEAIAELEASRPAVVLFEPSFYDNISTSWPNTPVESIAVDPVRDYIVGHYHSCANLSGGAKSHFSFMARNGAPCPAAASGVRAAD
jgi:hypothetical protein